MEATGNPSINIVLDGSQLIVHIEHSSWWSRSISALVEEIKRLFTSLEDEGSFSMHELYDIQVPIEVTPTKIGADLNTEGVLTLEIGF